MPEHPEVSTKNLSMLLGGIGYQITRKQRTHLRLEKIMKTGTHRMTIPNLSSLAPGTLNDILTTVSRWNQISKTDLLEMLKK